MPDPDRMLAEHAAIEAAADEIPDVIADAGDDLRETIVAAHAFHEKLGGEEIAEAAAETTVRRLLPHRSDLPWRDALEIGRLELVSETRIGQLLEAAAVYGENGALIARGLDVEARAARIREMIEEVVAFDAALPRAAWGIEATGIAYIARQARGRWALDHGEPVEAGALAAFGGVTERRIRNMMSKGEAGFVVDEGRVTAASALAWLKDRESFRPSVWRDDARFEALPRAEPLDRDELRFVPVTDRGEVFHPGLTRDGAYEIVDGDADLRVEGYEKALALLQTLQPPSWRRPGPGGRWTRVRGVRWERMTITDLRELAVEHRGGSQ
ncbi:hypothetical protein [uncultured Albimonas sp.]|uniref:hypothetical protein n=1 Tax=uncultured Albimonas sp. TaxID=1331701 RepID=UPI0030ECCD5D|tara:strand:- start:3738 stop:4718 length:981 start_codon:yes stop_codon:yes gene_type:complete